MHKDRLERGVGGGGGVNYITLNVFMNLQSSLDELELNEMNWMLDLFLNRFSFESLLKAPEQCLGVYFNRKPSPLSKKFDFASLRQSKKSVITDNELSHD